MSDKRYCELNQQEYEQSLKNKILLIMQDLQGCIDLSLGTQDNRDELIGAIESATKDIHQLGAEALVADINLKVESD